MHLLATLRSRCPDCHLTITKPFDPWSKTDDSRLRKSALGIDWSSKVDKGNWALLLSKCAANGVTLPTATKKEPYAIDTSSESLAPITRRTIAKTLQSGTTDLQTLILHSRVDAWLSFDDFPATLTSLQLDNPLMRLDPSTPFRSTTLNYIYTTSVINGRAEPWTLPKSLTFLEASRWRIHHSAISAWTLHDFERLCIHLIGIMDWQIPRFMLGPVSNPKTRSNMVFRISYGISGLLLPQEGIDIVTSSNLIRYSEDWLIDQLVAPAPRDAFTRTKNEYRKPSLRDHVTKATWDDFQTCSALFFNNSARVVLIDNFVSWRFGHTDPTSPFDDSFGALRDMRTLKNLTRLEIKHHPPALIFDLLPPGLRFLRIRCSEMHDLGKKLPPALEVLMIEQIFTGEARHFELSFTVEDLPRTLVHFGVFGSYFSLVSSIYDFTKTRRQSFPTLKTLYLIGGMLTSCGREAFPRSIERCHVLAVGGARDNEFVWRTRQPRGSFPDEPKEFKDELEDEIHAFGLIINEKQYE